MNGKIRPTVNHDKEMQVPKTQDILRPKKNPKSSICKLQILYDWITCTGISNSSCWYHWTHLSVKNIQEIFHHHHLSHAFEINIRRGYYNSRTKCTLRGTSTFYMFHNCFTFCFHFLFFFSLPNSLCFTIYFPTKCSCIHHLLITEAKGLSCKW